MGSGVYIWDVSRETSEQDPQQDRQRDQTQQRGKEQAGSRGGLVAAVFGGEQNRVGGSGHGTEDHHDTQNQTVCNEQPQDCPHNHGDNDQPDQAEQIYMPAAENGLHMWINNLKWKKLFL